MENKTNSDHVVDVSDVELTSKNQLRNDDVPNYLYTNGNSERSNLISSSVDGNLDGRSNVNITSSNGRHLPSNRRVAAITDVSIVSSRF